MHKFLSSLCLATVLCIVAGCSKPAEVTVAKAVKKPIEELVTGVSSGTVLAEKDAELAFGSVGRVSALHVALGDTVKKNDILAELENEDLKTALRVALREETRATNLTKTHAVSDTSFDDAQRIRSYAEIALEKTLIRAPFDGFIAELNLEVGQLAQITAVLPKPPIRLVDTAPRYIKVQFDEIDLIKISEKTPARIKIHAAQKEPLEGVVRRVIPYVSSVKEQDRTAEIEVNVVSKTLLPVGASADVELILSKKDAALVVPTKAVLGATDARFIFRLENNHAVKTPIKTGISNFDVIEVLDGIAEGQEIIIPDDKNAIVDQQAVRIRSSSL